MIWSKKMIGLGLLGAAIAFPAVAEESIDISLNDEAVQGKFSKSFRDDWARWSASWLHHRDNGDAATVGLHATGPVGEGPTGQRIRLGLGGVLAYYTRGGEHGLSLALGGDVTFRFPASQRFYTRGYLHWAPGVLSTGDGEAYREFGGEFGVRVIPRVDVYAGARNVRGKFDQGPAAALDRGVHLGLRVRF